MLRSLINKRLLYATVIGVFIFAIFVVFALKPIAILTNDKIDVLDKIAESWNPAETVWRFNAIKGDTPLRIRSVLSRRVNYYLSDVDLQYLNDNISDGKAWSRIFGKIPEKVKLFQIEQSIIFGDLEIMLILVPSIDGWKIDNLKSIDKFGG